MPNARPNSPIVWLALFFCLGSCYHAKPITVLRGTESISPRVLFIALDGIDYELVQEMKTQGHFAAFNDPIPLISTFPSDTTIGFTGLFAPLDVGRVPGYESRFYSYKDNKVIGGTPLDVYKIPINYKYYFDSFRHKMEEKAVMYSLPGMAGKHDLIDMEKALYDSHRRIVFTYIGSTDGAAHVLGRNRTKRFLTYMDAYLKRMVKRYQQRTGEDLRIVMFSDHGFQYSRLKNVSFGEMKDHLTQGGFRVSKSLNDNRDVVAVRFGLLSGGVMFAKPGRRGEISFRIAQTEGVDLVTWYEDASKVFIMNSKGERARFEYQGINRYRYVPETGDPLGYVSILKKAGLKPRQWLSEETWFRLTWNADYPDAGYRLYDAFFQLVENGAAIMFSTLPNYQYGPLVTLIATYSKFGQRGTHGGMFRQTSWAFAMASMNSKPQPAALRYDDFFPYFIPQVTRHYQRNP